MLEGFIISQEGKHIAGHNLDRKRPETAIDGSNVINIYPKEMEQEDAIMYHEFNHRVMALREAERLEARVNDLDFEIKTMQYDVMDLRAKRRKWSSSTLLLMLIAGAIGLVIGVGAVIKFVSFYNGFPTTVVGTIAFIIAATVAGAVMAYSMSWLTGFLVRFHCETISGDITQKREQIEGKITEKSVAEADAIAYRKGTKIF